MSKKTLFGSILSLTLAAGIVLPSGANAEIMDDWSDPSYDPTTMSYWDITHISITPGYGHVKMEWDNRGTGPVEIALRHQKTEKVYFQMILEPGYSSDFISTDYYPEGLGAGDYYLSYSSPYGSHAGKLNVDFTGFSSNLESDVAR